jgi:hypothetical protein
MQDQLDIVKDIISSFLKDSKEGKKDLVEWFLNSVMEVICPTNNLDTYHREYIYVIKYYYASTEVFQ